MLSCWHASCLDLQSLLCFLGFLPASLVWIFVSVAICSSGQVYEQSSLCSCFSDSLFVYHRKTSCSLRPPGVTQFLYPSFNACMLAAYPSPPTLICKHMLAHVFYVKVGCTYIPPPLSLALCFGTLVLRKNFSPDTLLLA